MFLVGSTQKYLEVNCHSKMRNETQLGCYIFRNSSEENLHAISVFGLFLIFILKVKSWNIIHSKEMDKSHTLLVGLCCCLMKLSLFCLQKKKAAVITTESHPPTTPLTQVKPSIFETGVKRDGKRPSSSYFNVSKNRELAKLPLLKGHFSLLLLLYSCLCLKP